MDLANPGWAGKLGVAPGETDFQQIITSLAWLKVVRSNAGSHIYRDNETLTSEVDSGQVEIGLIDPYYGHRLHAQLRAGATHSVPHYFAAGVPLACEPRSAGMNRATLGSYRVQPGSPSRARPAPSIWKVASDHAAWSA